MFRIAVSSGLLLLFACGGDDNGTSSASSNMTPEERCTTRCQLQVDAQCANTPTDYLSGCTALCLAKYTMYPECESAFAPYDACSIERVSYVCESDTIRVTPAGACAAEGAGCVSCTGDLFGCL